MKSAPTLDRFKDALRLASYPYDPRGVILAFEGGSVMHGASVGNDDSDYYAVYLEPSEVKLGLRPVEHFVWSTADNSRKNTSEDIDLAMYALTKFSRLCCGGNPTILHFLFVENALGANLYWDALVQERRLFLARSHLDKFIGYGDAQFDRLLGRKARKQFRPELIEKHGYDTKAALHGVRLMYEAKQLMETGTMVFPNPYAPHLLAIPAENSLWTRSRQTTSGSKRNAMLCKPPLQFPKRRMWKESIVCSPSFIASFGTSNTGHLRFLPFLRDSVPPW